MNFDFHEQFNNYSNIDLLKIVRQPANYQPAAVTVAQEILHTRQVTEEELAAVDQYFLGVDNSAKDKQEIINTVKNKLTSFLEPVLQPGVKAGSYKWINLLYVVILLQYAWTFLVSAGFLVRYLGCNYCKFSRINAIDLLDLLEIGVIFYLLFNRRRWGWILLFADNLFALISRISQSYIFFNYQSIHGGSTASFLVPIFIRAAFVAFLWRESIAGHFGVPPETKKKTAFITIIGTLLYVLIVYLLF